MFKTILAATDCVTERDPAVDAAARLAAENDGRFVILHVLESSSTTDRRWVKHYATGEDFQCDDAYTKAVARRLTRTHAEAIDRCDADIWVATGYPWEEILRRARHAAADLIVLGPHGSRARQKGVIRVAGRIGSTVQGVLTREKCPVMIVNPRMHIGIRRFSRILVGID